jgi:hypothetical protein
MDKVINPADELLEIAGYDIRTAVSIIRFYHLLNEKSGLKKVEMRIYELTEDDGSVVRFTIKPNGNICTEWVSSNGDLKSRYECNITCCSELERLINLLLKYGSTY